MKRRDFLKVTLAAGAYATVSTGPWFLRYGRGETPIKYGLLIPLTGGLAELAADQKVAGEIAVEEINAKGGMLGRKVDLIIRDTEFSAAVTRRKAMELLNREKIDFLTGACSGFEEMTLNDLARKRNIIYFTLPQYMLDTKKNFFKYSFGLNVTPFQAAAAGAKWAAKYVKGDKWHLLADNYSWPKMWVPAYEHWAKETGKQWTGVTWSPFPTTDYSSFIPQIRAKKPDVLFTVTWGSGQINLIKQMHEFGMAKDMKVLFGVSDIPWAMAAGAGSFEGMYAGMPWYWKLEDEYPASKAFNKKFFAKTNRMPAAYGQPSYATPHLISNVVNEVKSLDKEKIRKALEGRRFSCLKSEIYIRPCDHVPIQQFYFMKGKSKSEMANKYDFFTLEESVGGEDIVLSCKAKGL
ncbi:MAG: ABC transporter substrate-binding protein [Deltaproteobacteria bacterium]|nr:ABC transporter substrate-binding protein [Deltaproteobacteria bacterium]